MCNNLFGVFVLFEHSFPHVFYCNGFGVLQFLSHNKERETNLGGVRMNKVIKIISYIMTILFLVYMIMVSGFDVLWFSMGGEVLYYHPELPLTEEYSGQGNLMPALLLFIYVLLSGIYFIKIGYKGLKNNRGKQK